MSITAESICNMALGHLKIGKEISVLDTDKSAEAAACRLFYETVRGMTMEEFKWPFAKTQVALALVEESPFPVSDGDDDTTDVGEWAFSYRYPANCANFIRILSGYRNDTRDTRVPFVIMQDSDGKLILTDMENAYGEFTIDEGVEDRFTYGFAMALSLKLAVYIAPRLTGGDPFKLSDRCMKLYEIELSNTTANALNEEQREEDPESELIRARN